MIDQLHHHCLPNVEQRFKDIQLLAFSPLQRTQLQERVSVLKDAAFSSGNDHELNQMVCIINGKGMHTNLEKDM